jgi:hypothetical protein
MVMSEDTPTSDEKLAEIVTELVRLRRTNETLVDKIGELTEQLRERNRRVEELEEENEELRKAVKRQAAPFRRRDSDKKPKSKHKKPGRKNGHEGSNRPRPEDDEVDEEHEVPLLECPCCGGDELSELHPLIQYVEDIEVRRVVHKILTYSATCEDCGRVRSRHPLQVSEATGAAGVGVGPNALAFALDLNKRLGLSLRKTSEVLKRHLGLSLSPGGLVQANHRLAEKLEGEYDALIEQLRDSAAVYADETSWWVGESGWWLWTFTNDEDTTVYSVQPKRSADVVDEFLEGFDGVLISDCLNVYDNHPHDQQKCYAHHLRAVSAALKLRPDSAYLRRVQLFLRTAMGVEPDEPEPVDDELLERLEGWASKLLAGKRRDDVEEKIRNRLDKQRDCLFTFLTHPEVDATNNAAERAIRPAVIARKISCGNRTTRGKRTWEVSASLAASLDKRDEDFAELIRRTARLLPQRPHAPPQG